MITGFFGIMSSGKGVMSTAYLRWWLNRYKKHVIANCYLNLPQYTRLTTDQLYEKSSDPSFFANSYLYITELHNILESRRSGSTINVDFTQFLTQVGKVDCTIIYDTQLVGQADIRMREFTTLKFYCERYLVVNGKKVDAVFSPRIPKQQICIKLDMERTYADGKTIRRELGYAYPQQEDFDFYKTREIILMDREKYKKKARNPFFTSPRMILTKKK